MKSIEEKEMIEKIDQDPNDKRLMKLEEIKQDIGVLRSKVLQKQRLIARHILEIVDSSIDDDLFEQSLPFNVEKGTPLSRAIFELMGYRGMTTGIYYYGDSQENGYMLVGINRAEMDKFINSFNKPKLFL